MATAYTYTGDQARDYPGLGVTLHPGDVIYLDRPAPGDGNFEEAPKALAAPATEDGKAPVKRRRRKPVEKTEDDEKPDDNAPAVDAGDADKE